MINLPILLFQGGTHGNFLAKCLSVACGIQKDFNFYGDNAGAHSYLNNTIVNYVHESEFRDIWAYIYINESDLYKLVWHTFWAAGEFNFDLLKFTDCAELHAKVKESFDHSIVTEGLQSQLKIFNNNIDSVREMFRFTFKSSNGFLKTQETILNKHSIKNLIPFADFYNKKFKISKLLKDLKYDYVVDINHILDTFINRKQNILYSERKVHTAFEYYKNKKEFDISNFVIYEQAYLDYLVEKDFGKNTEVCYLNGYPTNILDIHPVEAWDGVQYMLP